jgi:hypothetical protein
VILLKPPLDNFLQSIVISFSKISVILSYDIISSAVKLIISLVLKTKILLAAINLILSIR